MSRPYDRKPAGSRSVPEAKDQWYVLHVLSNKEKRTLDNLKRLIEEDEEVRSLIQSEPKLYMEKIEEVRNGKKYTVERKLYPGYIYLNIALRRPDNSLCNDAWYKIQAVDGVISFACGRNKEPLPMPASDVRNFLEEVQRREGIARPKVVFNVNDIVVVRDGAFKDERGVVEEVDAERGRLRVGVTMFGRSNALDLDYTQVQHVPDDELNK
ncbi:MAG TPA: transcription termination/antitermination protein NusG [Candidatus Akkermansia intestinigallinarum]|uniref:Transcription termination/antitermination protein NusG n=1 Tax=Candidatus Akkermansia intestinigallinarum TaxID=2838431 RepID=A0A9D1VAC5_9BACT|nr:transcription termination/antitermination protein NusG [Candidatus Akkermansia intestinigallinarum]